MRVGTVLITLPEPNLGIRFPEPDLGDSMGRGEFCGDAKPLGYRKYVHTFAM